MTHTELFREIAPRFILAMVDGDRPGAGVRAEQLIGTCPGVRTEQFTYTEESAWTIVDTILGIPPTRLCHVQDELDRIWRARPRFSSSHPERTTNHPVMILCVFSRLFIAIGTDSWY